MGPVVKENYSDSYKVKKDEIYILSNRPIIYCWSFVCAVRPAYPALSAGRTKCEANALL